MQPVFLKGEASSPRKSRGPEGSRASHKEGDKRLEAVCCSLADKGRRGSLRACSAYYRKAVSRKYDAPVEIWCMALSASLIERASHRHTLSVERARVGAAKNILKKNRGPEGKPGLTQGGGWTMLEASCTARWQAREGGEAFVLAVRSIAGRF